LAEPSQARLNRGIQLAGTKVLLAAMRPSPIMPTPLRQSDLDAFLDEALPPEEMARIEQALRDDSDLARSLAAVVARRDAGVHTLGAVWRRHRLSCPTREMLGSYLLGVLDDETADYVTFHLEQIGCRYCRANVTDLRRQSEQSAEEDRPRRRRFFQSSAGRLRRSRGERGNREH